MFCPSCGAEFDQVSRLSHLVVCGFCESSVILDEKAAQVSGKMAVLPPSTSPLFVGATGRLFDRSFEVLGRARYGYSNGYWDEWYLTFDDDSTAWVSEDEGNYTLETWSADEPVPVEYASVEPGQRIYLGKTLFHVDEKDIAICEGAQGQLPFEVIHGEKTPFLDLSADDSFATVEWELDGSVRVFRGRRLELEELHLDYTAEEMGVAAGGGLAVESAGDEGQRERIVRRGDRAKALNCYHCGSSLELPEQGAESIDCQSCGGTVDLTLRPITCAKCSATLPIRGGEEAKTVVCSHCNSQLDIRRDEASVLGVLTSSKRPKLSVKIGQTCKLRGDTFTLVGHIRYTEREEGINYNTDEFLLHSKSVGYKWLSLYNGHFSFSEEIAARPKTIDPKYARRKKKFSFDGRRWTVFEKKSNGSVVSWVDGELPWVARVGDGIGYMDAVSPPFMLSAEWTSSEMEWYRSEYIPRDQVAEAFGIKENELPRVVGVGGNQPFISSRFSRESGWVMRAFVVLLLVLGLGILFSSGKKVSTFTVRPAQYGEETLSPSFTIDRPRTICRVDFEAPVDNSWIYFDVAVVNAKDEALIEGSAEMSYYHGYEGGESWSEGSRSDSMKFKLNDPGEYRLLLLGQAGTGETPGNVLAHGKRVKITVYRGLWLTRFVLVMGILALIWAIWEPVRRAKFESKRWSDE